MPVISVKPVFAGTGNNLPFIRKCHMNKYGRALSQIIKKSGISKNSLHKSGTIDRNILNMTLRDVENPGVASIEKYLEAFGANWHDWASALDTIGSEQFEELRTAHRTAEPTERYIVKKKKPMDQDDRSIKRASPGKHSKTG